MTPNPRRVTNFTRAFGKISYNEAHEISFL
jgi:hypothetical protein